MGKSALLALAVTAVCGIAAWRLPAEWILAPVLGAILVFFVWFFKILAYASEHPDAALLEGAEWTSYRRFVARTRELPAPPSLPAISDPAVVIADTLPSPDEGPEQEES